MYECIYKSRLSGLCRNLQDVDLYVQLIREILTKLSLVFSYPEIITACNFETNRDKKVDLTFSTHSNFFGKH